MTPTGTAALAQSGNRFSDQVMRNQSAKLREADHAMMSGVISSSMKLMRSFNCSLRFFRR
jgi:hypothetical protein